jgi:serine phosphatase RsbU (regulator of sigma subunit)
MGKQYKILVADDSASIREGIQNMLTSFEEDKYNVISANNGLEACTLAFRENPDLILIDIEMPVMDGISAIEKIKNTDLIKNIPIIVMSSTRQLQKAVEAGANDFLIKPFNQYKLLLRVALNIKIADKEAEIKRQHELLMVQRQEAINQRDTISLQKNMLMDELIYASYIQNAILPSQVMMSDVFESHFIFNRPKNIVSGDFYWTAKRNGQTIIAVGDCTGHGVSGALMTMAGIVFFNEIISKSKTISTDQLLKELRSNVIQLLNQRGNARETSNGMDIALCIFDESTNILQFSGAYSPLYLVRASSKLEIFKGDRMPIGYFLNKDLPFTKQEIKISKGDTIYLFSDGYPDQFGGPLGKKFRYDRFRDLIYRASLLPSMENQLALITETMDFWMINDDQVDDMLIIGGRF